MSDFKECPICKEYDFLSKHNCGDKYEIRHEDDWEWTSYYGYSHEAAALQFAKKYNEDGEYILMNSSLDIEVRKYGEKEIKKVCVGAEPDVYYTAKEI